MSATNLRIFNRSTVSRIIANSGLAAAVRYCRSLVDPLDVDAAKRFAFNGRIRWQDGRPDPFTGTASRRARLEFPFRSRRGRQMVLGVWVPWDPRVPIDWVAQQAAQSACRLAAAYGFRFAEDAANEFQGPHWATAPDPRVEADQRERLDAWLMEGDWADESDL